jgi:hypothetical protein
MHSARTKYSPRTGGARRHKPQGSKAKHNIQNRSKPDLEIRHERVHVRLDGSLLLCSLLWPVLVALQENEQPRQPQSERSMSTCIHGSGCMQWSEASLGASNATFSNCSFISFQTFATPCPKAKRASTRRGERKNTEHDTRRCASSEKRSGKASRKGMRRHTTAGQPPSKQAANKRQTSGRKQRTTTQRPRHKHATVHPTVAKITWGHSPNRRSGN